MTPAQILAAVRDNKMSPADAIKALKAQGYGKTYDEQAILDELQSQAGGGDASGQYAGLTEERLIAGLESGRISPDDFTAELRSRQKADGTRVYSDAAINEILAQSGAKNADKQAIKPPSFTGAAGLADTQLNTKQAEDLYANDPAKFKDWLERNTSLTREEKALAQKEYDDAAAAEAKKNAPPSYADILKQTRDAQLTKQYTTQAQNQIARDAILGSFGQQAATTQTGSVSGSATATTTPAGAGTQQGSSAGTAASPANQTAAVTDTVRKALGLSAPSTAQDGASGPPVTGNAQHDAFIAQMWPSALKYSAQTAIPPEVFVAINASESGWGGAGSLFGIKGVGPGGKSANYATFENENGNNVNINDQFATYDSPDQGYEHFLNLISGNLGEDSAKRYGPAWQQFQQDGDWQALLNNINKAGYATDPTWGSMIGKLAGQLGAAPKGEPTQPTGIAAALEKGIGNQIQAATQPKQQSLPAGWDWYGNGAKGPATLDTTSGRFTGNEIRSYNPTSGLVGSERIGLHNDIFGSSIDPVDQASGIPAFLTGADAQTIERYRSLPTGDRAQFIRDTQHREPTWADLLWSPGGTFPNGDPMQNENRAAIAATGKSLPGLGYKERIDPFNSQAGGSGKPGSGTPVSLNDAPVMTPEERSMYLATGSLDPASLGGRTLGEVQLQNLYGSDPVKSVDQLPEQTADWYRKHPEMAAQFGIGGGQKSYAWQPQGYADGGTTVTGPAYSPEQTSKATHESYTWDGGGVVYNPFDPFAGSPYLPGMVNPRASLQRSVLSRIGQNLGFAPYWSAAPYDWERRYPTAEGTPPIAYADGGVDVNMYDPRKDMLPIGNDLQTPVLSGADMAPTMGRPLMGAGARGPGYIPGTTTRGTWDSQTNQYDPYVPWWMREDARDYVARKFGPSEQDLYRLGGVRYTPRGFAGGGIDYSQGPEANVNMQTGQINSIDGEAGPEAKVYVPLTRPAENPIAAAVQQLIMGAQRPMQIPGASSGQLRQMAQRTRPVVKAAVAV